MTRITLIFLMLAAMMSLSMSAQQQNELAPERMFNGSGQVVVPLLAPMDDPKTRNKSVAQFVPGDESLAVLNLNTLFARRGQEVEATLIFLKDVPGQLTISARIFYPGSSGRHDEEGRVAYFYAKGTVRGTLSQGVSRTDEVSVYSARVAEDYTYGEYIIDVTIRDSQGSMRQQISSRFYVVMTGPFGRYSVKLDRATWSPLNMILEGQFSMVEPAIVWVGTPGRLFVGDSAITSPDGRTLKIPIQLGVPRESAFDVTVCYQTVRECSTLPAGLLVPVLK